MKIAFISDIHGNYAALKAVLQKIDSIGVDKVYCLGDVAGYYSEINECCNELRARNIKSVMGNHDWYMATNSDCPRSKSANDCLKYQRSVITKENKEWISSFPHYIVEDDMMMVHGGLLNPIDEYLMPTEDYFELVHVKFFISGHSHVPRINRFKNVTYCNPGAVGQPRDNNSCASFLIKEDNKMCIYRVAYNIDETVRRMNMAGFSSYYTNSLYTGSRTLKGD